LCRGGDPPIVTNVDGVTERNKRKVQLFVEAVWNEGRIELIDDLVADDYVGRVPCVEGRVLGPGGMRRLVSSRRQADLHVKIDDQIAEDDLVATRWRATIGNRTPCCAGISIIRLLAGKQVDCHTEYTTVSEVS